MALQVGRRGQDRPADHRRRPRRHRHEPLAHDERVGHARRIYLQSLAYEFAASWPQAARPGARPGDRRRLLSTRTHIFKALALGAPFVKAVCMGRALMIPGMVGKNIGEWIKDGDAAQDGQPVRHERRRDLRLLRGGQDDRRQGRDEEHPAGRGRHLHLRAEAPRRPAAADGRQPQLQPLDDHAAAT